MIGLGGGLLSSYFLRYGLEITSIEIDPAVVYLARKYFSFQGICHVADGRRFLKATNENYDFIILDVYRGEDIPAHLCTREFFEMVAKRLSEKGILAVNLIGSIPGQDTGSILKTVKKIFPQILLYGTVQADEIGLLTFFASKNLLSTDFAKRELKKIGLSLPPSISIDTNIHYLLTDDQNFLPILRRETARKWRKISQKSYGG
jgi:spermidine synthase